MARRTFSIAQSSYGPNESLTFFDRSSGGQRIQDVWASDGGYAGAKYPNGVVVINPAGGSLTVIGPDSVDELWAQKRSGGSRTLLSGTGNASGETGGGGGGGLAAANNLSDLANAATARTNLGLGGAAVLPVGTSAGTVAAGDAAQTALTTAQAAAGGANLFLASLYR
jgi:hypothetical protein